ncbi:MAG TPA: lysylphosphatidylglycerol synthase transmembrane domain-containing protein [Terracidiphilus sp.]
MSKRQWIAGLVVLAALIALVVWARHRIHFDFHEFAAQLRNADWGKMAIALACIYLGYVVRSVRWSLLLRHNKRVAPLSLVDTQIMGFTAVALIGRVADLVRPYLVAKKTGLDLSSQIAVYIVERLSDMGAVALLFSIAILDIPQSDISAAINNSSHLAAVNAHAPGLAAFLFRYGGLLLTVIGALFLVAIRLGGEAIAAASERIVGLMSKKLGKAVGDKMRTFRAGLDTIRSFSDFASLLVLSLGMWALIAGSYFEILRAFVASPPLATITPSHTVLLMVVSGGASIVQLPVLGWFSQIGIVAAAITGFFHAAPEASTACAAMLLIITFLGIVPVGLVWAQFQNVNLRKISVESEHAGHDAPVVK